MLQGGDFLNGDGTGSTVRLISYCTSLGYILLMPLKVHIRDEDLRRRELHAQAHREGSTIHGGKLPLFRPRSRLLDFILITGPLLPSAPSYRTPAPTPTAPSSS